MVLSWAVGDHVEVAELQRMLTEAIRAAGTGRCEIDGGDLTSDVTVVGDRVDVRVTSIDGAEFRVVGETYFAGSTDAPAPRVPPTWHSQDLRSTRDLEVFLARNGRLARLTGNPIVLVQAFRGDVATVVGRTADRTTIEVVIDSFAMDRAGGEFGADDDDVGEDVTVFVDIDDDGLPSRIGGGVEEDAIDDLLFTAWSDVAAVTAPPRVDCLPFLPG